MRNIAFYEGVSAILVETHPTIAKYMNELIGEVEALKEEVENANELIEKVKMDREVLILQAAFVDEAAERHFNSYSWAKDTGNQVRYMGDSERRWIMTRPELMKKLNLRICEEGPGMEAIPTPKPIVEVIEEVLTEKAPAVALPAEEDLPF